MLNTTPEKTGSSNNMLIGGVIMCFVFFPLLYSLCSKRGLFILWHNIFSFVTSVCLSVQVSGGPSGGGDKLCEPGALGPTRVEVLLAPCASSLR